MFHDDGPERPREGVPWGSDQPPPPAREVEEPREATAEWRGRDLVIGTILATGPYLLLWLLVWLVPAEEAAPEAADPGPGAILVILFIQISVQLWMAGVVVVMARRRGITLASLGLRTPNWRAIWLILPTWLGAYVAFAAYLGGLALAEQITGTDLGGLAEGNPVPVDEDFTTTIWIVLGISVVLAAPVVEELFFRGLLFLGLDARLPSFLAMVLSGFAFSLVHQNIAVLIPFTVIGILLAWSYRATGSLWTPIGAHLLVNGVAFTLTVMGVEA